MAFKPKDDKAEKDTSIPETPSDKTDKVSKEKAPPFQKKDKPSPDSKEEDDVEDKDKPKKEKVEDPKQSTKIDFEPTLNQEELEYIFEGDLSDLEEHAELIAEAVKQFGVEPLDEALTIAARMRKKFSMNRIRRRLVKARERAMARRASTQKITGRARRSAIQSMKIRFSAGRSPDDLTYSEKDRVERMVKRRKGAVDRLTNRMVRTKRADERTRLQSRHHPK